MSVDTNAVSFLPNSVNASNAESGANSALSNWNTLSSSWTQETADACGKASISYSVQWSNAVMPTIDAKISKLRNEYEEKKSQYEAVKSQYDAVEVTIRQAQKDMKACMGQKPVNPGDNSVFSSANTEYGIIDHYGYNLAKHREAQAKAEENRYEAEMNNLKRQMKSVQSNISKAEKEKEQESKKIENFILNVYNLNLMNESVEFLQTLKSSSVEISKSNQNKLYSRLFLIQNKYRRQFEKFEEIIKSIDKKYKTAVFEQKPDNFNYFVKRIVKSEKFKSEISISLISFDSDSAKLSFTGSQEFFVSKKKLETAKEKVQSECKNYVLQIDKSNFKIDLKVVYENDAILEEVEKIDSDSDLYAAECEKILKALKENGASKNKLKVLFGKIGNKIAHSKEKRDAYKKMTPEERAAAKAEEKRKKYELKESGMKEGSVGGNNKFRFISIDKKKRRLISIGLFVILWIVCLMMYFFSR